MKIVVESKIPFVGGLLDPYAEVAYLAPEEITPAAMRDADALLTRTRTRCDASLLDGSPCRFIATATIGTDHIDLDYCRRRGIAVANAPGCNAPAVAQYVVAAIIDWLITCRSNRRDIVVAVVGVGHVGTIVARWLEGLDIKVMRVDPPRAAAEGPDGFYPLADATRYADFITFHTPLTYDGPWPTYHLAGEGFFDHLQRRPIIINTARGPVVDSAAMRAACRQGLVSDYILDCWEGEPNISVRQAQLAFIATPHIAGYSREGKIRASMMALEALAAHCGLPHVVPPEASEVDFATPLYPTAAQIGNSYSPFEDSRDFREIIRQVKDVADDHSPTLARAFERLRNSYRYRHEVR